VPLIPSSGFQRKLIFVFQPVQPAKDKRLIIVQVGSRYLRACKLFVCIWRYGTHWDVSHCSIKCQPEIDWFVKQSKVQLLLLQEEEVTIFWLSMQVITVFDALTSESSSLNSLQFLKTSRLSSTNSWRDVYLKEKQFRLFLKTNYVLINVAKI
jgi:hypothetical protein